MSDEKGKLLGKILVEGHLKFFPLITTDDAILNISGGGVLSIEKNSHYYDIDDGTTPDFIVADKEEFLTVNIPPKSSILSFYR